jgi:hypothetical protein
MASSYADPHFVCKFSDSSSMIHTNHNTNSLDMTVVCLCGKSSRREIFTNRHSALFNTLIPHTALRSARAVLPVRFVKQLKCLCILLPSLQQNFTHARTHARTHTYTLLFKLFHCHFVTNPTKSLCKCSVQPM